MKYKMIIKSNHFMNENIVVNVIFIIVKRLLLKMHSTFKKFCINFHSLLCVIYKILIYINMLV